eukprot:NODE_4101_length_862_cov_36.680197_g3783_i0.p1 GENE.NODE_4101_length_862_cov_36.680197_g3783_i0~~NODE_4101_length_862_cov_36.680197_g3783_i0.p1  ORF type:complete len:234 (+),score=33.95 NODE_4101_length_862_cov_36.680197_g3783_i0:52-753(+)
MPRRAEQGSSRTSLQHDKELITLQRALDVHCGLRNRPRSARSGGAGAPAVPRPFSRGRPLASLVSEAYTPDPTGKWRPPPAAPHYQEASQVQCLSFGPPTMKNLPPRPPTSSSMLTTSSQQCIEFLDDGASMMAAAPCSEQQELSLADCDQEESLAARGAIMFERHKRLERLEKMFEDEFGSSSNHSWDDMMALIRELKAMVRRRQEQMRQTGDEDADESGLVESDGAVRSGS